MFPDIRYIFWIRNPRDCIVGTHITGNLNDWGIACPPTDEARLRRAKSWKYQYDLVRSTPRPRNWIEMRFEDFVQCQDETLAPLESYLGVKLARIRVNPEAVGRWKTDPVQLPRPLATRDGEVRMRCLRRRPDRQTQTGRGDRRAGRRRHVSVTAPPAARDHLPRAPARRGHRLPEAPSEPVCAITADYGVIRGVRVGQVRPGQVHVAQVRVGQGGSDAVRQAENSGCPFSLEHRS